MPAPSGATSPRGACARGAFELALDAEGRVQRHGLRWLVWDGEATSSGELLRMASASRWEVPAEGSPDVHVVLHLECTGAAAGTGQAWADLQAQARASLRARQRAATLMRKVTGTGWSEHDLDCLWGRLEELRRGPFLYDDLALADDAAARIAAATAAAGGVWVCRAARSTHMGQLVILDRKLQLLGVAPYRLGE